MTRYPEPTDVGPAAGGDLPISADDRKQVLALLTAAHNEGRITQSEYTERYAAAGQAQIFDDLAPLTRDLIGLRVSTPIYTNAPISASTAIAPVRIEPTGANPNTEYVVAIFGGGSRPLARLRKLTTLITIFGGEELDLSHTSFDNQDVEIRCLSIFGSGSIFVPPGVNVVSHAVPIFGDAEVKGVVPAPGGPTITLTGLAMFSSLSVYGPESRTYQRRLAKMQRRRQS
ncbi:MAG: DUF1707 SHOCT-like domain-containing protein [Propionibacteriaceae bacterium]